VIVNLGTDKGTMMNAQVPANRRVVVVVPCYNEAARLPIEAFRRFFETSTVEVVFVDDGSRDHTLQVLEQVCKMAPAGLASFVASPRNQGKAEAVRFGIGHALGSNPAFVGYWDADLATPLDAIPEFIDVLSQRPEVDMVFGSRVKLLGRMIERKAVRHYLGRVFATVVSTLLRLPIYDTQCGAKIFRLNERTRPIFNDRFISRWVFDVELIARYIRQVGSPEAAARRIYELPLRAWADIGGSKVKPKDFFVAFWDVVKIRYTYLSRSTQR
jgi:dolichyl-phosphate beta-glucosyltransferase